MKTRLVNKEIRHDYTAELLKERGVKEEDLSLFLGAPDISVLQNPSDFDNIELGYELFNLNYP